jgi:hypothetical protein
LAALTMPRLRSLAFLVLCLLLPTLYLARRYHSHHSPVSSPPKITIIAIWNPKKNSQAYLPNFFASAKANAQVDFLFIVVDKDNVGCDVPIPPGAPNIKAVCLSVEEYLNLHVDFLCNHWACGRDDKTVVLNTLHERYPKDFVCIDIPNLP